jgi:hypothetical protein
MNKEFIPYKQALALKELGFNEPCFGYFTNCDVLIQKVCKNTDFVTYTPSPLYQQCFRWFREKYNFCSWVYQVDNSKYFFSILEEGRYLDTNNKKRNSYEEAELECLIKLISIVKEKK